MKRRVCICALVLLLGTGTGFSQRIMFWNLENFFDSRCDSTSLSEMEFSSRGERHWSSRRFRAKCSLVAKALLWTAGEESGLPDIVGLAEIENKRVLKGLLYGTALEKLDYSYVHFDSPDPRGIDVALLYRKGAYSLTGAKPCHIYREDGSILPTRDILLAEFVGPSGDSLAVLVNHHPSKYGGAESSQKRLMAVSRMRYLADSLLSAGHSSIVMTGDFNDSPRSLGDMQPFINLGLSPEIKGTIRFRGRWETIDFFLVSESLSSSRMKVLHIPFLEEEDKAYGGKKPLRTYSGPRYLGGVSDHCPILLVL